MSLTQGKYRRRLYCDHVTEMLCHKLREHSSTDTTWMTHLETKHFVTWSQYRRRRYLPCADCLLCRKQCMKWASYHCYQFSNKSKNVGLWEGRYIRGVADPVILLCRKKNIIMKWASYFTVTSCPTSPVPHATSKIFTSFFPFRIFWTKFRMSWCRSDLLPSPPQRYPISCCKRKVYFSLMCFYRVHLVPRKTFDVLRKNVLQFLLIFAHNLIEFNSVFRCTYYLPTLHGVCCLFIVCTSAEKLGHLLTHMLHRNV